MSIAQTIQERMDQDELRQLLTRAEEIQAQSNVDVRLDEELRQVVAAAEEAGLDRESIMRALKERKSLVRPLAEGELVFARSADGHSYPARLTSVDALSATVKFLNGGDSVQSLEDVRRLAVIPGMKLEVPWPNWGWWPANVVSFDVENSKVKMNDGWGNEHTFHISDVRLRAPEPDWKQRAFTWGHMGLAALGGTAVGMLLMKLLAR